MNASKPLVREARGVIDVTRRGVGYFPHEDHEADIEIAPEDLGTALHGDEVLVTVTGKRRGRIAGVVRQVLQRATEHHVGELIEGERSLVFKPDNPRFYPTVRIADREAAAGDKVLIRIDRWVKGTDPTGSVVEVLGRAGEHETEMRAAVIGRGMNIEFPPAVSAEADALDEKGLGLDEELPHRRDFRDVVTFTIDPEDAKDFDDALSVALRDDGTYEVGVHIADVTHYLRPGTALDTEARTRATSIYLVDRTIPMLPEVLSNDLCSLKPDVDRLTFSAVFTMDKNGTVLGRWFGKTVIHSDKRFTYHEAQKVLDTGEGPHHKELSILRDLAHIMRGRREKKGALGFDTDEVRFELAADGTPIRAYVKDRVDTMRIIEDWMLLANQEVAAYVANLVKNKKPIEQTFIYRVHDLPKEDRLEELRLFVKAIGYDLSNHGDQIEAKDLNDLLKKMKGKPEEKMVQIATLRSMAKAIYTHRNIGHFSLAFNHYTHFTSPIRRYADVMVHRILFGHLNGTPIKNDELTTYQHLAIKCSEREVNAVEAERDSVRYKQVEYMAARIGQTFAAQVTGVTEHGLFVAENETRAEGLVHISTLGDDFYDFNPKRYRLEGKRSKQHFTLGDAITVRLTGADITTRRLDWALVN